MCSAYINILNTLVNIDKIYLSKRKINNQIILCQGINKINYKTGVLVIKIISYLARKNNWDTWKKIGKALRIVATRREVHGVLTHDFLCYEAMSNQTLWDTQSEYIILNKRYLN